MKIINLTNNKGGVMVDDEDWDKLSKFRWHLHIGRNTNYAVTYLNRKKRILMHRFIMNPKIGKVFKGKQVII